MNKILYHPKEGTTGFFYGEFPNAPIKPENFTTKGGLNFELGGDFGYEKALIKYNKQFEQAKQEVINKGEIINPELIIKGGTHGILFTLDDRQVCAGDTFELPEGVKVEPYLVDLDKKGNVCYKGYRLVKEEKEQPKQENQMERIIRRIRNNSEIIHGHPDTVKKNLLGIADELEKHFNKTK